MTNKDILHPAFWLWVPVAVMIVQIILEVTLPSSILSPMHSENGPHELMQFFLAACGCGVAVFTLSKLDYKSVQKWLAGWIFLAAICCFYVAGEEISWGQHILDWATPEFWKNVNDQQETNLHNVSSWLDQKPRLILEIGILFGGIIFPLLQKYRPGTLPQQFSIIYPPAILSVTAVIALGSKLIVKITESFDIVLFNRYSEVEEMYLFYFVLIYLVCLKRKIANEGHIRT